MLEDVSPGFRARSLLQARHREPLVIPPEVRHSHPRGPTNQPPFDSHMISALSLSDFRPAWRHPRMLMRWFWNQHCPEVAAARNRAVRYYSIFPEGHSARVCGMISIEQIKQSLAEPDVLISLYHSILCL